MAGIPFEFRWQSLRKATKVSDLKMMIMMMNNNSSNCTAQSNS